MEFYKGLYKSIDSELDMIGHMWLLVSMSKNLKIELFGVLQLS